MATVKLMDLSVSAWSAAAEWAGGTHNFVLGRSEAARERFAVETTPSDVSSIPEYKTATHFCRNCLPSLTPFQTQSRCTLSLELLVYLAQFRTQNRYALLLELL
ncbi:hypothetical protein LAC81_13245 [Ensifer adhaerens]|uniref:hypothetical protein n=1 Tax=Ensifer adhaerens TaxID=106592 RepID=UPI001CC06C41|nr:hypothetical protein [Ensifer adhaerens]MBZ7922756.1 hypothetical protein [Ensifer adhaerens]UAX94790.1 hypothetical protein LAC78_13240 [Ensifer adhaerens]UAY02422.1 hypothetical protein LAC80_13245 [Ensifer adhaerens]UAY09801.1 hypothetical protein LAC81_13245 [Ensifer adhaerens]